MLLSLDWGAVWVESNIFHYDLSNGEWRQQPKQNVYGSFSMIAQEGMQDQPKKCMHWKGFSAF